MVTLDSCLCGNALDLLPGLVQVGLKVQCFVTSPPYWGQRDYGVAGQFGLEKTPGDYIEKMVRLFGYARDILADDGTLWLILGDSYVSSPLKRSIGDVAGKKQSSNPGSLSAPSRSVPGLNNKNLAGIPWRLAFALQEAGWILRSAIVWHKPNPMPESVKDRPTRSYENVFLFSKCERYFYDADAAREPAAALNVHDLTGQGYSAPGQPPNKGNRPRLQHATSLSFARRVNEPERPGQAFKQHRPERHHLPKNWSFTRMNSKQPVRPGRSHSDHRPDHPGWGLKNRTARPGIDTKGGSQGAGFMEFPLYDRNWRDVWTIPVQPFLDAHFATMPEALARRCLTAGSREGDLVMDPFMGAGTVAVVAKELGRKWLGVEINPDYLEIQKRRLVRSASLLTWAGI